MADVRDILELEQPLAEVSRDSIIHGERKKKYSSAKAVKRPEGMHREVFALLYNDNKELPPLMPTDTGAGYKQAKAKLGMRKVRKWVWAPFSNPARKDNAVFHHWRRASDPPKEYPFAQFNKQVSIPTFTESEYNQHLKSEEWSQPETEHLLELCSRFDLRFLIIHDRWDRAAFRDRTVEDLKERYYHISTTLTKLKTNPWSCMISSPSGEKRVYQYDAEHERRRKEQLQRLFDRTQEQIDEEQTLLAELKKIEARKRDRERKTQDLQKLISLADGAAANDAANTSLAANRPRHDKKLHKKKLPPQQRPTKLPDNIVEESSGLRFPEPRGGGAWLRSLRMKLPAGLGQRKTKGIEADLKRLALDLAPPPTEDICTSFNELRSDLALQMDLKAALASYEFELQALRHQYEALQPGKTLTIPPSLCKSAETDSKPSGSGEMIDVLGSPGAPN